MIVVVVFRTRVLVASVVGAGDVCVVPTVTVTVVVVGWSVVTEVLSLSFAGLNSGKWAAASNRVTSCPATASFSANACMIR